MEYRYLDAEGRERHAECCRDYNRRHREEINEYNRLWRKYNPGYMSAYNQRVKLFKRLYEKIHRLKK